MANDSLLNPQLARHASQQGGVFTAAQAIECGYSRTEMATLLRRAEWHRLRRGVFSTVAHLRALEPRERYLADVHALLLKTNHDVAVSHASAAVIHRLPLIGDLPRVIHVTRPANRLGRIEAGAVHHGATLTRTDTARVTGIPVTSVARTVIDIARTSPFPDAVVIADAALREKLVTLAELRATATAARNWAGVRAANRVVEFARAGAESPGESLARIYFARNGLPAPELQAEIFDAGDLAGRVDFLWRRSRTIGEFDGRFKYASGDPKVLYAEKRREDRLRALGYQFVRFGWADVQHESTALARRLLEAFARYEARAAASD